MLGIYLLARYDAQYKKVSDQRLLRRKKKRLETKRIYEVYAIQAQMDVWRTLFQSTISLNSNNLNQKLQVFVFARPRLSYIQFLLRIHFSSLMIVCQVANDLSS